MAPKRVYFSILLPLAAIGLWIQLVPVPAAIRLLGRSRTESPLDMARMPAGEAAIEALDMVAAKRWRLVMATNLPGGFVEILISLPTTWPYTWHPKQLQPETWRSLSYPFYCLPAWWLVGIGTDWLKWGRTCFRRTLAALGAVLSAFLVFLFVGLSFFESSSEWSDKWLIVPALGVWAAAFGLLPFAWFRQRNRSNAAR